MSKYIEANRLMAEIERYENTAIDAYNPLDEDDVSEQLDNEEE